jgi:hypothetical protein
VRCEGWILGVLLIGSCGCANFVDTITARDFKINDLWSRPPDPLTVLQTSTDGAKRGQALANMKEPLTHGGTQEQQELYIKILVEKATKNPPPKSLDPRNPFPPNIDPDTIEPLVRLGAIRALGDYKDPRAAVALSEVYQGKDPTKMPPGVVQGPLPFLPQMTNHIKMQALDALARTGSPIARDLFIVMAETPGPDPRKSSAEDQNQTNDERLAALRGLARFHDQKVLNALVGVLESERTYAQVRDVAWQSLKQITGKNLPPKAEDWRNLIQRSPPDAFAHEPGPVQRFMNMMGN